jgi:hypothetical protein
LIPLITFDNEQREPISRILIAYWLACLMPPQIRVTSYLQNTEGEKAVTPNA